MTSSSKNPFWQTFRPKRKQSSADPVIKAIRKVYKGSRVEKLDKLLAREGLWRRRHTIADNKLREIAVDIRDLASESVYELAEIDAVAREKEGQ
jgi:hypothetical protein